MTPAPNRRWPRVALLTLSVVVIAFGCWSAYELNWIRQRHVALTRWEAYPEEINDPSVEGSSAPGMLWLFGEPGYWIVNLSFPPRDGGQLTPQDEAEIERARSLFPEAEVDFIPPLPKIEPRQPGAFDGFKS